jgi:hypothetical protein
MWHSGNLVVVVLAGRLLEGGVHSRKPRSRLHAFYRLEWRVDVDLDWSGQVSCSRALSMIAIFCPNSLLRSYWLTPDVAGPVRLPEFFATFLSVDACNARHSQTARILRCIPMTLALPSPVRLPEFFAAFPLVEDAWFARSSQAARILCCIPIGRRLPCRDQSARASSKPKPPSRAAQERIVAVVLVRVRSKGRRQNLLPGCDFGA